MRPRPGAAPSGRRRLRRWRNGRAVRIGAALFLCSGLPGYALQSAPAEPTAASVQADPTGAALTPQMFGARCDSTGTGSTGTDDTAAFQRAIDLAATTGRRLHLPGNPGMCRLTAPLTITRHVMIEGDYCQPVTMNDGRRPTPGNGSWLYFDHPGKGLVIGDGSRSQVTGVVLADFCTIRNQPLPQDGAPWTPTPNDFDIAFVQDDLTIRNVMLLNPTKGVSSGGRLLVEGLHGQPMQVGLALDATHDTATVSDVHFWPYWMDNPAIETFTRAQLDAVVLGRVDNPVFSNITAIYARTCFRVVQGREGTLNKFHGQNIDCDLFGDAAWAVDGAMGATWQVTNFTGQGDDQLRSRALVAIRGKGNVGTFVNTRGTLMGGAGVTIEGANNDMTFVNLRLERWGQRAVAPGVAVARDNTARLAGAFQLVGGPAGAMTFSGAGLLIQSPQVDRDGKPAP